MSDHLGENAALYALGMLSERETAGVLAHASACDACGRLLAQAEDDVATIAATQPQFEPPATIVPFERAARRRAWYAPALAFAAALILAIVPASCLVTANQRMHQATMYADAVQRMIESPHRTVAFSGQKGMVMYATDGSWYCVFARGAKALSVAWVHDGQRTMLGTMVPHGDVALLYLPKSHKMNQLAIMNDGQVIGQANLVF